MVIGHVVTTELSRAQLWKRITVLGTPHNFVDASLRHVVLSTCHASPRCFFKKNYRVIEVSRVINFQLLKLVSTLTLLAVKLSPSPLSGHPPPLLAPILTPPHPSPPSDHIG